MFDDEFDRDGDEPAAAFVEPSAELLALWAAEDARYEDPKFMASAVAEFLAREAFYAMESLLGEPDGPCEGMDLAPGSAALATWAGDLDSEALRDYDLIEQIAALERAASWVKARQLAAIEVLSRRTSMNPEWPVAVSQSCIVGEEVAARLGTSRLAGRDLVEAGKLFAHELMATGDALEAGDLDWVKAKIVVAALKDIPWQVVEDVVLPTAGERTPSQLRADLQKALIAVDAADAEKRTARAVDTRRVCKPKVLPDGMAGIWSVLPAFVATAIDTALTDAAWKAKHAGDTRTIDQLRADAYTGTLLGDGPTCADAGVGCPDASTSGTSTSGTSTEPATSSGSGSHTSSGSDTGTGTGTGVGSGTGAGSGTSSSADSGADTDSGAGSSSGSASAATSRCTSPACGGIGGIAGQIRIDVTVSLTTLLGLDDDPAQLAGYGAITAQTARRLAANVTWRRLVTDAQTGTVLDVGKTRYRPPADLAEIIRARDPYCVSPICNTGSRNCDLDHRVPFNPDGTGGATSIENIAPACRRDHLLKTHAGWQYDRADNGTITWTTPTGHVYTYRSPPPPGHEHLPQVEPEPELDAESKPAPKPEPKPQADDPPPF